MKYIFEKLWVMDERMKMFFSFGNYILLLTAMMFDFHR